MNRYAAGDESAYREVHRAIAPRLFAYLLRRTRDSARAEDNLQQTLLQVHRARGKFTQGAAVLPWAFTIARRVLADGRPRGVITASDVLRFLSNTAPDS